eukprot:755848-Hanusia_phi.AAC.7
MGSTTALGVPYWSDICRQHHTSLPPSLPSPLLNLAPPNILPPTLSYQPFTLVSFLLPPTSSPSGCALRRRGSARNCTRISLPAADPAGNFLTDRDVQRVEHLDAADDVDEAELRREVMREQPIHQSSANLLRRCHYHRPIDVHLLARATSLPPLPPDAEHNHLADGKLNVSCPRRKVEHKVVQLVPASIVSSASTCTLPSLRPSPVDPIPKQLTIR